jgi:hypothetical protein
VLLIEAGQMTASDYVPIYPDLPLASEGASTDAVCRVIWLGMRISINKRNTPRAVIAALSALLFAPRLQAANPLSIHWEYSQRDFPDSVSINVKNDASETMCIPHFILSNYHSINAIQNGKMLLPTYFENRPVMDWKGVDLWDGLIVLPPGKASFTTFDLNDWPGMDQGTVNFDLIIQVYSCRDIFSMHVPKMRIINTHFQFNAKRSKPMDTRYLR